MCKCNFFSKNFRNPFIFITFAPFKHECCLLWLGQRLVGQVIIDKVSRFVG
nr:MAG TPA: hypothetical protein [Caudoviricetes sp.]